MIEMVLGIGDMGAINTFGASLKTYALGSCVAVIFLDPPTRTIGMVHIALPESGINPDKAKQLPGYFADTGIPALIKAMDRLGCRLQNRKPIIKLAGGAAVIATSDTFNIGKRNLLAVRKILAGYGLTPSTEDVGGTFSRTVSASINTGVITLSSPGRPTWTI